MTVSNKGVAAFLGLIVLCLGGCQQLPDWAKMSRDKNAHNKTICLVEPPVKAPEYNCDIQYWLLYWANADSIPWPERRTAISTLDESLDGQLRKILLSQPVSTPYQDRLRAQSWFDAIKSRLTQPAADVFTAIMAKPSQQLLELESALTVMSRINTQQAKSTAELKQKLQQLMNIEAELVDAQREQQP
ncbi:hypothetical protein [Aestuariibacter salexigens]|uniref:hypothetical protein n=1 Tax=Aestuariibacter salexigens TaxID=226010 RepID=UPI00040EE1BC|nr:hypothetical protein [Aestuariibacter salexigens]